VLKLGIFFTFILASFQTVWAADQQMLLENEKNTISIFKRSVDSVVNVSNIKIARRGGFFGFDLMEIPAGQGTGFVWDKEGHIVTNYHVIANGDSFLISFHNDKNQYKAKVVGGEPRKDIAVLKLEEMPKNLTPINVGESKILEVGQKALAIGNPFGLDHTITEGIISALDRKIQGFGGVSITGMIQTDCSINPGNSGGPLLNSSGQLIGMNTMIFSNSGSSSGVGFSVPVSTVKQIVPQLIKHGKVVRPGLGIGILEDQIKAHFGIDEGLVIKYIDPKGGANQAGLRGMGRDSRGRYFIGDIILEVDGKKVNNYDDIYLMLENYKVGDVVTIKYIRDGKKSTAKVTLIEV